VYTYINTYLAVSLIAISRDPVNGTTPIKKSNRLRVFKMHVASPASITTLCYNSIQ